jgi:hypothetical protein
VDAFMGHDIFLLEKDVGERAISHRLGLYLQSKFSEMNVDCEYNRKGSNIDAKRFGPKVKSRPVYPDIIVHKRGDDSNNILAIEVKKQGRKGLEYDETKLKHFTLNDYHKYRFGLLLIFNTKKKARSDPTFRWFKDGEEKRI